LILEQRRAPGEDRYRRLAPEFYCLAKQRKLSRRKGVMNKDQVKGKIKDVAGRIERQAGEWTGGEKKEVHGAMKQAEGKIQNAWGNVKDAGKKAADEAKAPSKSPQRSQEVDDEETASSRRRVR
jgi:uncharacterized protein YjbJ (UPF0337 family)